MIKRKCKCGEKAIGIAIIPVENQKKEYHLCQEHIRLARWMGFDIKAY